MHLKISPLKFGNDLGDESAFRVTYSYELNNKSNGENNSKIQQQSAHLVQLDI